MCIRDRILLVEDDIDSAEAIQMSLEAAGYPVALVQTAHDALEFDLDSIDVMVSDIGLPDMSGHDLMRALRQKQPLRAIALSGYGTERDIEESRRAGFASHLTKPVELN